MGGVPTPLIVVLGLLLAVIFGVIVKGAADGESGGGIRRGGKVRSRESLAKRAEATLVLCCQYNDQADYFLREDGTQKTLISDVLSRDPCKARLFPKTREGLAEIQMVTTILRAKRITSEPMDLAFALENFPRGKLGLLD